MTSFLLQHSNIHESSHEHAGLFTIRLLLSAVVFIKFVTDGVFTIDKARIVQEQGLGFSPLIMQWHLKSLQYSHISLFFPPTTIHNGIQRTPSKQQLTNHLSLSLQSPTLARSHRDKTCKAELHLRARSAGTPRSFGSRPKLFQPSHCRAME